MHQFGYHTRELGLANVDKVLEVTTESIIAQLRGRVGDPTLLLETIRCFVDDQEIRLELRNM